MAFRTYLGSAVSGANASSYTFNTGFTLVPGRILVEIQTRAATAVTINSVTIGGTSGTDRVTGANADGAGTTRMSFFTADTSASDNDVAVTLSASAARCSVAVYLLIDTLSAVPFDTLVAVADGSAVDQSGTIDTPANGLLTAMVGHTDGSAWRHSGGSTPFTAAATGLTVSVDVASAGAATWTGVTEDFDAAVEAGVAAGDGVMIAASWESADTQGELKGLLTGTGASVTNPSTITGSVAVDVDDLVVVVFGQQTTLTATAVTDNLGNTYSAQNAGTDGGAVTGRMFYALVTVAGTLTSLNVAATASANDYAAVAGVFRGPFAASPIDANPANSSGDVTSPFTCPATGTLAQADEVVVAWGTSNPSTAANWTTTPPLVLIANASLANKTTAGYRVVSSTSDSTPEFVCASNPTSSVLGTASFKLNVASLQTLTPDLYTDGDTFHSPTAAATYGLTPALFSDGDTFFTPVITVGAVGLTASLFQDEDSFHSPTITTGAVGLTPSLFTDDDAFHAPTVSATYGLAAALFSDGDTFFTPVLSVGAVTLTPALFSDGDSFHTPAITTGAVGLTASLFSDGDTFHSPTVSQDAGEEQELEPALYADDDTFFTPVVTVGAATLAPSLFSDGDTFFTPTITTGSVGLTASLYQDGDTFHSPTVTSLYGLQPSLLSDGDTFHAPSVTASKTLQPALFSEGDTFFTPVLTGTYGLSPALFVDSDAFHNPAVTNLVTLTPSLFTDGNTFFSPLVEQIEGELQGLEPSLFTDSDAFFVATLENVNALYPPFLESFDQIYLPEVWNTRQGTTDGFATPRQPAEYGAAEPRSDVIVPAASRSGNGFASEREPSNPAGPRS